MKRKIVYIIGGIWGGSGMERVLIMKANYMADIAGYDVTVLLTEDGSGASYFPLSERIKVYNVHVNFDVLYTYPTFKKVFQYFKKQYFYKRRLRNFLMELKPDITVSAMRREINFINDIPDGSKKVGEIHFSKIGYREVHIKCLPAFINQFISKVWFNKLLKEIKRLSAFVVLTNADKENWPSLSNIHVIYNPIPFLPISTSDCSSKKIIAVGRYDPIKGFDLLLNAWDLVVKKHPDWILNIYGGGDNRPLKKSAQEKGLSDNFICNGPVKDIISKYCDSSIFVLSSRQEGFGLVLVEAMSCGVPCVSFACPSGPKEIVQDGLTGFLVDNGDIVQLADKMIYLIEHPEERRSMGTHAKSSIDRFKIDTIGKQWEVLFSKVLNS